MKIFQTNTSIYSVRQNEDGTLAVVREYFYKAAQWQKDGNPIQNAGMFISQQGGIDGMLARCREVDDLTASVNEWNAQLQAEHENRHAAAMECQAKIEQEIEADYERLFSGEVTETNEETVGALLRHLNLRNWGFWSLPKMTIGYACHQYNCDGKTATTIKLDSPIIVCGEEGTMFEVGAPNGLLTNYRRI